MGLICGKCLQPCEELYINETTETSEFWGRIATHKEYDIVSDCCQVEELYTESEAFYMLGDSHLQQDLFYK